MNKMGDMKIKETIKTSNGKLKYCLQVEQGDAKMQIYIHQGEIYFESCGYGFNTYPVFDLSNESHVLAKEVFINSLKADVRNKCIELKQLETILNELGLKDIISDEIQKGSILLSLKQKLLGKPNE